MRLLMTAPENFQRKLAFAKSLPWFASACPQLASVTRLEELPRLPLTTLDGAEPGTLSVSALFERLLAERRGGLVLSSGGSTGLRKHVVHSWAFNRVVVELGARGVRAGASELPERMLNCLTAGELQGAFLFAQGIGEALGACVYPMGWRAEPERLLELIRQDGLDTLVATPSFAVALLGSEGASAEACPSLRRVLYIGERFSEDRRALVRARFPRLRLQSLGYSSAETGPLGYQCAHQGGADHHVHEDAVRVEILAEGSREPAPPGTPGEVVVTPLAQTDVPLFRYRIGDRGVLLGERCPCGSTAPVLRLLGRSEASTKIGGALVTKGQVLDFLRRVASGLEETDVQVVVQRVQGLSHIKLLVSEVKVGAEAQRAFERAWRGDEHARLLSQLPGVASVALERVSPAAFKTSGSGKAPFFLQA